MTLTLVPTGTSAGIIHVNTLFKVWPFAQIDDVGLMKLNKTVYVLFSLSKNVNMEYWYMDNNGVLSGWF